MKCYRGRLSGLLVLVMVALVTGCSKPAGTGGARGDKSGTGPAQTGKSDQEHEIGPHGGTVADWGGGKFHIEFTLDHGKQEATIYVLDGDAKKAVPIKAKDGQISASIAGGKDKGTFEVFLKAAPQQGDPEGKASRFVGKHDRFGAGQEFEGSVTGEDEGTPYTGKFKQEPAKK